MTGPEDQPTEPLRPRVPVEREAVVATEPAVDPAWAIRVDEQVRNLKGLVALLSVLALVAAGLAVWALLRSDDNGDQTGASQQRVARLDDRVDRLESELDGVKTDVSDLDGRVAGKAGKQALADLNTKVDQLKSDVAKTSSPDSSTTDAIDELGTRVDQLEQDVSDLQAQQQGG